MTNYFIDILEITLPVSAVILMLAALSPLIKRRFTAKWRYYMWLFIAVRVALPFKLAAHRAVIEIPNVIYTAQPSGAPAAGGTDAQRLLTLIYVSGVLVFFLFQAACLLDFGTRVRRWERDADERTAAMTGAVRSELGISRNVKTVVCKAVSAPMMTGLLKPKLILPDRRFEDNELSVILRHELIHLKNNDIPYKLALMIANGLNWFNPAVYLMVRMANRDVELVCDSEVVRGRDMEYRREYCRTLLSVAARGRSGLTPPLSTGFAVSRQVIKERIEDILSSKLKKRGIAMFAAVALSVGAAGSVIGFAKESIEDKVEENLGILERTTPIPKKTETSTLTEAPVSETLPPGPPKREAPAKEPQSPAVQPKIAEAAEQPQESAERSAKASWWSDDMGMTREELDANRDGAERSAEIRNISGGAAASMTLGEDGIDEVTMGSVYYVEPNRSMTIYHNGGVISAADAVSGELVYDSANDEDASVGIVTAGDEGAYYRVNVSRTEESDEKVEMYIIEK